MILAHHTDDQAETVLWNLLRGAHGLRGMQVSREVDGLEIHRPLLKWRRSELREWLEVRGLKWREDATNAEPVAVRNRLRNEVIPLLAEVSQRDPAAMLNRLAEDWEEQRSITEWALDRADVIDPQGRLHVPALRSLPAALQFSALSRFLADQGIAGVDRSLIVRGISLIDSLDAPSINLPGGKRLRRRGGRLFVE